jgi:type IV secretory pathway VirB4 component
MKKTKKKVSVLEINLYLRNRNENSAKGRDFFCVISHVDKAAFDPTKLNHRICIIYFNKQE